MDQHGEASSTEVSMVCVFATREDWEVVHQRVELHVQPSSSSIRARTELIVLPHDVIQASQSTPKRPPQYNFIHLNASHQLNIRSVMINGLKANYNLRTTIKAATRADVVAKPHHPSDIKPAANEPSALFDCAAVEADYNAKLDIVDEGELKIDVPEPILKEISSRKPLFNALGGEEKKPAADGTPIRVPVLVAIEYVIENPIGGVRFIVPSSSSYSRLIHCFTVAKEGNVSCWLPCRDSHWERFTFEMEITCPSNLVVLSSGKFVHQDFVGQTKTEKTYKFSSIDPVLASSIGWVIGEFDAVSDVTSLRNSSAYFLLRSGHHGVSKSQVLHTCSCISDIFATYEEYLNTRIPFDKFQFVFVESCLPEGYIVYGNLILLDAALLHGDTVIEQTYEARPVLAQGLHVHG
jgi:hypothetical protein